MNECLPLKQINLECGKRRKTAEDLRFFGSISRETNKLGLDDDDDLN